LIQNYYRSYVRSKSRYLLRMLGHRLRGQPRVCPYCGPASSIHRLLTRKFVVEILRCSECRLIFRWPQDSVEETREHYENGYAEEAPQIRLPAPEDLPKLVETDFSSLFGDLRPKLELLRAIQPGGRVLDYGCSWAYATWLLQKSGYDAVGFEIARSRAAYGRKHLGVKVMDSICELEKEQSGGFDAIYSNHVLEHVSSIGEMLELSARLLREGGLAFHILPNFTSKPSRAGLRIEWIGEDHPIAPTVEFFRRALPAAGFAHFQFATSPFGPEVLSEIDGRCSSETRLDGDELLVVAWKSNAADGVASRA
jgi:2-polyprenyl-3-methyl-5-hydroxy-6-metoxy-1,4-benzoquinol methylase